MFKVSGLSPMRLLFGFAASLSVVCLTSLGVVRADQPVTVTTPVSSVIAPDPSRQAFSATFSQSSTTAINASFGTVPAGKRLVIENESVACYLSGGGAIEYAYIITNLGRTYLLLQQTGTYRDGYGDSLAYYTGTFTSTMYADPQGLGTGDITFVLQTSSPSVHCDGAIVGHNVAAPRP